MVTMVFLPYFLLLLARETSGILIQKTNVTRLSMPHRQDALPMTRSAENIQALHALLGRSGSTGNRVELHVQSKAALARLMQKSPRYIFGVTTGHAGSTSLSSAKSYSGESLEHVLFAFEGSGIINVPDDPTHSARKHWQSWWLAGPSAEEQESKVRNEYKAGIDAQLLNTGATTYVDLGHHNVEGILRTTPKVFGEDLLLIRVRRSRFPTAFSFATRVHRVNDSLCNNMWTICPTKNEAMLRPAGTLPSTVDVAIESIGLWSQEQWQRLDTSQQHFWFIDELEAEWQRLLEENPGVSYLECDWVDDLRSCFEAVAAVLGTQPSNGGEGTSQRPHAEENASDNLDMLHSRDLAYQELMAFSDTTRERIAKAQF